MFINKLYANKVPNKDFYILLHSPLNMETSMEEVVASINKLKRNKAPGPDKTVNE